MVGVLLEWSGGLALVLLVVMLVVEAGTLLPSLDLAPTLLLTKSVSSYSTITKSS